MDWSVFNAEINASLQNYKKNNRCTTLMGNMDISKKKPRLKRVAAFRFINS